MQNESLDEVLASCWRMIEQGATDRKHAFHLMNVATLSVQSTPRIRTVILRALNLNERSVMFHTDMRSDKIFELGQNNHIAAHFYDSAAKIQVRLEGTALVHAGNTLARQRWDASRKMSRMCYSIFPKPGTIIDKSDSYIQDDIITVTAQKEEENFASFAVVDIKITALDWLYLDAKGHKRAEFLWDDFDDKHQNWVVP